MNLEEYLKSTYKENEDFEEKKDNILEYIETKISDEEEIYRVFVGHDYVDNAYIDYFDLGYAPSEGYVIEIKENVFCAYVTGEGEPLTNYEFIKFFNNLEDAKKCADSFKRTKFLDVPNLTEDFEVAMREKGFKNFEVEFKKSKSYRNSYYWEVRFRGETYEFYASDSKAFYRQILTVDNFIEKLCENYITELLESEEE